MRLFAATRDQATDPRRVGAIDRLRSWRLPDGEAQELGRVDTAALEDPHVAFEPNGAGLLYSKGRTVYLRPLPADGRGDLVVSRHRSAVQLVGPVDIDEVVLREEGRMSLCCSLGNGRPRLTRSFRTPETAPSATRPERSGRWLINSDDSQARLWDLGTWPPARPLVLRRNASWETSNTTFHPSGDWLAVSTNFQANLTFWPLRRAYPTVVDGYASTLRPLAFTPDSRSLVTSWRSVSRQLRRWPVGDDMREGPRFLALPEEDYWADVRGGPKGDFVFVVGLLGGAYVVPLDGGPALRLEGFAEDTSLWSAAVSPSGRRVATAHGMAGGEKALRVWDLDSGEHWRFELPEGSTVPARGQGSTPRESEHDRVIRGLGFAGESTLYSGGDGGIHRWDLDRGTPELVFAARTGHALTMRLDTQGRIALVRQWPKIDRFECLPAELVDLAEGTARALPAFGECVFFTAVALDASGTVAATGDRGGLVRVGRLGQGEPHLLFGHSGSVATVAISPDLRWVASAGEDSTLRLWPMPDLGEPPLHTWPHDQLIAKLKSLTNLRAVRDPEASSGWSIQLDTFPGWQEVPEW
jgi:WD40 repeat protein